MSTTNTPEAAADGSASPSVNASWFRKTADKIPTTWLTAAVAGVFLAATAAFGGLNSAESSDLAVVERGEPFVSDPLTVTPVAAFVMPEFPAAWAFEREGYEVLVVRFTVENTSNIPQPSSNASWTSSAFSEIVSVDVSGLEANGTTRVDDGTSDPILQPHVPIDLVATWYIPTSESAGLDEIELDLFSLTRREGQVFITGSYWDTPVQAATSTLPVTHREAE